MSRAINTITAATAADGATNLNIDSGTLFVNTTNNNVGIGTTSPAYKLEVNGAFKSSSAGGNLVFNADSGNEWWTGSWNDLVSYQITRRNISSGNGTSYLTISTSGNVGIGTGLPISSLHLKHATPTSKITLEDSSTNRVGEIGGGSDGSGGLLTFSVGNNGGAITERLRIDSSGNVRIGTTSFLGGGHQALSVKQNADAWCMATQVTTNGNYGLVAVNASNAIVGGMIINASSTAFPTSSDYRLKTNIEPIINGIERVKQLPVYSFNWKIDESGNKVDGFIAHEAKAIVPESVVGEKDAVDAVGNPVYQGIDQSKIVPLLTAALKEAIAKIEVLESKVAALEAV